MAGKKTKSFSLDPKVKQFADELDNASAVVNDLLAQFSQSGKGRELAAIDVQIRQKERELERKQKETGEVKQDLDELQELRGKYTTERNAKLEEAKEKLYDVPQNEDNPAIQNWANKLDMNPSQLLEELENQPYTPQ